jgi:hypothetical protein
MTRAYRTMRTDDVLRLAEAAVALLARLAVHVDVRHVATCERCRALVDEVSALDQSILDSPDA